MSLAEFNRKEMESLGDYVIRANQSWFAVFPEKREKCLKIANEHKRKDFNLVVYRTGSSNPRDHHSIPFRSVASVFRNEYLTHSKVNDTIRWNCTLKDNLLHVSHSKTTIDVSDFFGGRLVCEDDFTTHSLPEELEEETTYTEGSVTKISVNRYERDPKARSACIAKKGATCVICGFDFGSFYGMDMNGFIHVHHTSPIHLTKSEYIVDPITDLEPVCPNCHAVLHSKKEVLTIQDVKTLIEKNRANKSGQHCQP